METTSFEITKENGTVLLKWIVKKQDWNSWAELM
jgi:hypothetical protein